MKVEGRGNVVPRSHPIPVEVPSLLAIIASVKDLNRYASRGDQWGRGLRGSLSLRGVGVIGATERPIVVGKVGEYAVVRYLSHRLDYAIQPVDFRKRETGDGGKDVVVFGMSLQVKTRQKSAAVSLVRRKSGGGFDYPLCGHAHIFCQWQCEHDDHCLFAELLGWMPNREMRSYPLVPARRGDHLNIEIPDAHLHPMSQLVVELKSKKEMVVL